MYLEDRDVVALSDAIKRPEVAWWMLDFAFPGLKKMMNKKMAGMLQNAPFQVRTRERASLFRRPRLADRRSGIAVQGCPPVPSLTDADAPGCLAAPV
jgi:hypothetical protein